MGTPQFAVTPLLELLKTDNKIVGVYTKKPKPANRGQQLEKSPIYKIAEKFNLKLFTPTNFKHEEDRNQLQELKPDLIVVVAYGLIIPQSVLDIPKYGAINVHPSLLPHWRGCAPIQRSLLNGDKETGVCIMKLDAGMDTGDVIHAEKLPITNKTTTEDLNVELTKIGTKLLLQTIKEIDEKQGNITTYKQDDSQATIAPKIKVEEGEIDVNDDIDFIDRQIRTFAGNIGTFFTHKNNRIKILEAEIEHNDSTDIGHINKKNFAIQCKNGILKPLILQREGKKPVAVKDFVNGYRDFD